MARKKKKNKNIPSVVPNNAPGIVPNAEINNGLPVLAQSSLNNQPTLSAPRQTLQTSPQTKSQRKIENATFPRLRAWWEGLKQEVGGTPETVEQYSQLTPQQQSILEYLQLLGAYGLQNPYEGFEPIAEQAKNQFYQETVPSLAHRFTSLGDASLTSGAFTSQLGQAGAGLSQNLAAQQAEFGQNNMQQALQMLQLGLNPYTENVFRPAQPGLARSGINALLKGLTLGQV